MLLEAEQKEAYPVTVKIEEHGSFLIVHIALKATWGKFTSPNLCVFYDEFGKNVRQASLSTQTKQPILSLPKQPLDGVKESFVPAPSSTLPSPPAPNTVPRMSPPLLPQGKVVWVYVNLREGPGIQHKIIGKAHMKTSFKILAEKAGWLRVKLENGSEGWMSKKAITLDSHMTPSPQIPAVSSRDSSQIRSSQKPLSPM